MISVLIVEDDPMVADINKDYVESVSGYSVKALIGNGEKAIAYLSENSIDLAIVDIYMPEMDGITFIKKLRQLQIDSDVIFVTASDDTNDISTSLKYGAFDYLIKPFKFDRLIATLENYKKRFTIMERQDSIRQEELDKMTKRSPDRLTLPKGLQKKTLEMISGIIKAIPRSDLFDAEIVSERSGRSTVTVRRYLEYMESRGILRSEVFYGTGGRPKSYYRQVK